MLQQYDRRPFLDLLAEWLLCSPDPEDIQKFANKYPDRYAGAMRQIAQVAGFTEKKEIDVGVNLNIHLLSDSQLEDKLKNMMSKVIDLTPEPDVELKSGSKIPPD